MQGQRRGPPVGHPPVRGSSCGVSPPNLRSTSKMGTWGGGGSGPGAGRSMPDGRCTGQQGRLGCRRQEQRSAAAAPGAPGASAFNSGQLPQASPPHLGDADLLKQPTLPPSTARKLPQAPRLTCGMMTFSSASLNSGAAGRSSPGRRGGVGGRAWAGGRGRGEVATALHAARARPQHDRSTTTARAQCDCSRRSSTAGPQRTQHEEGHALGHVLHALPRLARARLRRHLQFTLQAVGDDCRAGRAAGSAGQ